METDLTEDIVREFGLGKGLVDNKVCAIDGVWSGLRLVVRVASAGLALAAALAAFAGARGAGAGPSLSLSISASVLTALAVLIDSLTLTNLTTTSQQVTITDGAGLFILSAFTLQARNTITLPLDRKLYNGLSWFAQNASAVNGHFVGDLA